jgi:hypothetical protein
VSRWTSEARISVEATPRPQTDEDLARNPLQSLLHLDGIVASVEDEQGSDPLLLRREAEKRFHLLGGNLVDVLRRTEALYVHGGTPTLADEIELCNELVGPARYDRLACRVARGMVVETPLRAALRVAAIPHAHVHGVDGRFASSKWMVSEQPSQSFDVDSSTAERVVEAAPATAMRRL